ncbi:glycoside hydrolase family 125 protein [Caulobacter segnis]|uniref:glycoside hydrolase family 125 protein n=1 Tax=Caulobacter segnis TaxID=88688 RepID=UPI0028605D60|nr:glycoside hydrolase family 125 protein [Caulobacter segnis]MDR6625888.1 meiotically up-regulated gene 157 (Mug157) protein [Caulobacter segnis]
MSACLSRREAMLGGAAAAALAAGSAKAQTFVSHRPPTASRRFVSPAVEVLIKRVKAKVADPELAWLFENCFPNTLDTTVFLGEAGGKPDAFVMTGDIDCMWLRDSSAQVWPYLPLAAKAPELRTLFRGVIGRQARCILIDPYANAYMRDPSARTNLKWSLRDVTEMRPGVAERKWEIDSLCYPVRLAHGYWRATGDLTPFDAEWRQAMTVVVRTLREQQRKDGPGPYAFQRPTTLATETLMLEGRGAPTRKVGLIHSMFRPSDDACVYPFLIPSNLFAAAVLRQLAELSTEVLKDPVFAAECVAFADEVSAALKAHGMTLAPDGQPVWAFEVDGYGNALFMDDANAPGLLSLAYLGCIPHDDPVFRRTAALAWSERNPYFFKGHAAEGIGGPHAGLDLIWPMSLIMRGLNALADGDDATVLACLRTLKATHAGTGFMHEAFHKDDPSKFTRDWFAWANTLFGELIVEIADRKPALLARPLDSIA